MLLGFIRKVAIYGIISPVLSKEVRNSTPKQIYLQIIEKFITNVTEGTILEYTGISLLIITNQYFNTCFQNGYTRAPEVSNTVLNYR
ncbi:hypothetical protein Q4Q39_11130 [Flavivirga amylovorans]|uniref:Uncharacterized protein n=1 Tax=Flavivirga amylovorans TaxID=870486 RepID=A0ABT8X1X8_9FLAO|nr:hypothetical protein [Flavivirga amylovorans]MDO5987956.1 hypothetical protein [Flavivirga amylovorans]